MTSWLAGQRTFGLKNLGPKEGQCFFEIICQLAFGVLTLLSNVLHPPVDNSTVLARDTTVYWRVCKSKYLNDSSILFASFA